MKMMVCIELSTLSFSLWYSSVDIFREAAKLCKEVAAEGDALTLGSLSQCPSYLDGLGEAKVLFLVFL